MHGTRAIWASREYSCGPVSFVSSCVLYIDAMDIFFSYQQHFGFTGQPFTSSRDPGLYFDSQGHRRAFEYLRRATLEGECFMALTGDTGAGKTLLLRKLLDGLEKKGIAAALIGTVAGPRQLLMAILSAFRAPVTDGSVIELRAALQALVTNLAATGRRGLVAVDEAQHLTPEAMKTLLEISNPKSAEGPPLQILIAGDRQVRTNLTNVSDVTRQPLSLFCDLGPLTQAETRSYIEHRLRHVSWNQSPSFTDEAHDRIYQATDGVPRRINQLCHRLLLAACRRGDSSISPTLIEQTHLELCNELGPIASSVTAEEEAIPASGAPQISPPRTHGAHAGRARSAVADDGTTAREWIERPPAADERAVRQLPDAQETVRAAVPPEAVASIPIMNNGQSAPKKSRSALVAGSLAFGAVVILGAWIFLWPAYELTASPPVDPPAPVDTAWRHDSDSAVTAPAEVAAEPADDVRTLPVDPEAPVSTASDGSRDSQAALPADALSTASASRLTSRSEKARRLPPGATTRKQSARARSAAAPDSRRETKTVQPIAPCTPAVAALGLCAPPANR